MRKIVIVMASFPLRKKGMISSIKQLLPQCNDFYLWLNEYEQVPEELNQFDKNKLHITLSKINLKDNGRYTFIEKNKDAYFFICDDDIDWPDDYVKRTISTLIKYKDNVVISYFKNQSDFIAEHQESYILNTHNSKYGFYRFGSGISAFVPKNIGYYPTIEELNNFYDIELLFGQYCHDNNINVVSPARPYNYIKWLRIDGKLLTLQKTALHFNSNTRIQNTLNYINKNIFFKKNISLEDLFKNSFVLTIDEERFELFKKIFEYHQLLIPQKYEGFQFKQYYHNYHDKNKVWHIEKCVNCSYGHASIIKLAQYLDLPFVCIFEDDAYPCYDIKNKLEYYLTDIPDDIDCLILGNNGYGSFKQYNNKFCKATTNSYGTHAYIVFKNAYNKILNNYENDSAISDHVFIGLNNYSPIYNLFIQHNNIKNSITKQIHNHDGYFWKNHTQEQIFKEFPKIEDIIKD